MSTKIPTDLILVYNAWRIVEELTDRATASRTVYGWVKTGRLAASGRRIFLQIEEIDNHMFTCELYLREFLEQL